MPESPKSDSPATNSSPAKAQTLQLLRDTIAQLEGSIAQLETSAEADVRQATVEALEKVALQLKTDPQPQPIPEPAPVTEAPVVAEPSQPTETVEPVAPQPPPKLSERIIQWIWKVILTIIRLILPNVLSRRLSDTFLTATIALIVISSQVFFVKLFFTILLPSASTLPTAAIEKSIEPAQKIEEPAIDVEVPIGDIEVPSEDLDEIEDVELPEDIGEMEDVELPADLSELLELEGSEEASALVAQAPSAAIDESGELPESLSELLAEEETPEIPSEIAEEEVTELAAISEELSDLVEQEAPEITAEVMEEEVTETISPEESLSEPQETPPTIARKPTPEQQLVSAIQTQILEIAQQYREDPLIERIGANLAAGLLRITVADRWYDSEPDRQDAFADKLLRKARYLDFKKLELIDDRDVLVARSPVVGSQMVVFKRSIDS